MATRRLIPIIAFSILFATGCATTKPRETAPVVGPQQPEVATQPTEQPQEQPTETKPAETETQIDQAPVVLVLGPGMARGFAHAGVLRALSEAKIPVGAIVGTEMGALIGGIYAESRTIDEFEWKLQKLREDLFKLPVLSLSRLMGGLNDGQELQEYLEETLESREIQEGYIPLRIGIFWEGVQGPVLLDQGQAAEAIRASMSDASIFSPTKWEGAAARSAVPERAFPVSEAKDLSIGPVIVVNVLEDRLAPKAEQKLPERELQYRMRMKVAGDRAKPDLKQADFVLRIDLRDIGYFDFKDKSSIIFKAKNTAQKSIEAIKKLTQIKGDS